MTYETETLRNEYMRKAHDIGSNAITLVNEFFDLYGGIEDCIKTESDAIYTEWTPSDLDRALDAMRALK